MGDGQFDVFLSHNSADKPAVEQLAIWLRNEGIEPWLDKWNLVPGEPWQEAIEEALERCASCAVFIGPSGVGPWQNEEMRAAINRRVGQRKGFRVIPVVLPGGRRDQRTRLPSFLVAATWVEFRESLDEPDALHRLKCGIRREAPGGPGPGVSSYEGRCPYPGLRPFQVDEAPLFFGREARVQWLLNKLRPGPGLQDENRFQAIIGASGSGKSSLAQAGLLAALNKDSIPGSSEWPAVICRPGANPLESLAIALDTDPFIEKGIKDVGDLIGRFRHEERRLHLTIGRALHGNSASCRAVILVDQFEELFTICSDEQARQALLDNLLYAAGVAGGRTVVVLTMRADFLGKCAAYPGLAAALSEQLELVPPMTEDELRQAIVRPAQLAGGELETGLTEMLLQDMKNESGALPLLQHALSELWERRVGGRRLTVAAYKQIGRLEGALERRANEVLKRFSAQQQETCRRIFVRLTKLGEGTEDTKRRAPKQDLLSLAEDANTAEVVISTLADERLLITSAGPRQSEPTVEVAHEALIRSWSQLREWLDSDRESLRALERLREAARVWEEHHRQHGYLYGGTLLHEAELCSRENEAFMTPSEQQFLDASVGQLVNALGKVETNRVAEAIEELAPLKRRARPLLIQVLQQEGDDSRWRLHASLALLPEDLTQLDFLRERLLRIDLAQFSAVADYISGHRQQLREPLWTELEREDKDPSRRLRSAMALAAYDPPHGDAISPRWHKCAGFVARQLITSMVSNPSHYAALLGAFRPLRCALLEPLVELFRGEQDSARRLWVAEVLADFEADNAQILVDLACDADEKQFPVLLPKLEQHRDQAATLADAKIAETGSPAASEVDTEILAKQQANAAVALMRLGRADNVWPLLKHSPDPRRRSYLLHRFAPLGTDPLTILGRLDEESDASIRRALILSLGEFWEESPPPREEAILVEKLLNTFRDDADPGIHAAAQWVLRRWKRENEMAEIAAPLATGMPLDNRQWYFTTQGHNMVVIPGPNEFRMGSPRDEEGRYADEVQHRRRISRSFAIASMIVTVQQFQQENPHVAKFDVERSAPDAACPQLAVDWYDAAAYCNWLSEKEGIPKDQWCYETNSSGHFAEGMQPAHGYMQRQGYRLPSEAEWEFACRAGGMTSRYYGQSPELLGNYAWFLETSNQRSWPVGSLKPNDFGLFDMLGNAFEWCHDSFRAYSADDDTALLEDDGDTSKLQDKASRARNFRDSALRRGYQTAATRGYNRPPVGDGREAACCAAGRSTTTHTMCGRPTATIGNRTTATTTMVSVWRAL